MSELFDVVWYACVIVCLSSGKCFAYALDIHAALEDMGKSRTHGGYGGSRSFLYEVYLSFVRVIVLRKGKGVCVEENGYV